MKYFTPNFQKGFLIGKEDIFSYYQFALYTHIVFAPITILCALYQMVFTKSKFHLITGKVYVFTVLFLAAPSGLIMSFYAIGGLTGIILFSTLSILWFFYTLKSYVSIRNNDIVSHKKWAIGSFILANSAILLRVNNLILHYIDHTEPVSNYLIAGFLSWVPFLIIHEILANIKKSHYFKNLVP
ncbi:DUF2306 domain-containing protein [Flammeovirga yaeyamensis]|uniref:DUF2306 domain-containing protein n=1 Tax=Flammeovirga yaeyamensis TaxID=367791 RepID=A0AAX1N5P9_9BACT|nr:DUF2306 domain-containing protein [Flammeovirga yaeyamensis]NMF36081.1 DUF2306 domain-containing protein [Flammeovirga yaeyamensis]QWG02815.1 DUF2306 domain-containing protein [Flammeovirga yaeyamensis]